jgi:hypothetical protein
MIPTLPESTLTSILLAALESIRSSNSSLSIEAKFGFYGRREIQRLGTGRGTSRRRRTRTRVRSSNKTTLICRMEPHARLIPRICTDAAQYKWTVRNDENQRTIVPAHWSHAGPDPCGTTNRFVANLKTRRKAESLLASLRALKVGASTFDDVQPILVAFNAKKMPHGNCSRPAVGYG